MTDDIHIDGQNEEMDFEREDLGAKPILIFLLGLTIGCVLVALVLKGLYSYLDSYENRHQPAQNPLVQQTTADTRTVEPGDIKKFPPAAPRNRRNDGDQRLPHAGRTDVEQLWMGRPAGRRGANSHRPGDGTGGAARTSHPAASRRGSAIGREHGERSGAALGYKHQAREEEVRERSGRARLQSCRN